MKKRLLYLTVAVIMTATSITCTSDVSTLPMRVTLNHSSVMMIPGEMLTLTAKVMPDEAVIKTITWSSRNPDVATVIDGVVTAIAEGETTITVTTNSGQRSAMCKLIVAYPVSGVTLDQTYAVLTVDESTRLTATVLPESAPDKSLKWESSAPDVATVNEYGVVIAKAPGTATVTAITEVGNRIAICPVRVIPSDNYILMVFDAPGVFSFTIYGRGEAVIDFGDGSEFITHTLSSQYIYITHNYPDTRPYIMMIKSENIIDLSCFDNQLIRLDVKSNTKLSTLNCRDNELKSLDVSDNIELKELDCSNNQLTSLDASNKVLLSTLNCSNNQLTSLDLNANTALTTLNCSNNQITNLDASNKVLLSTINCFNNRLTSLDMSNNIALQSLNCQSNQLSAEALNALFETLHDGNLMGYVKWILIKDNPGTSDCDPGIATKKGWVVF